MRIDRLIDSKLNEKWMSRLESFFYLEQRTDLSLKQFLDFYLTTVPVKRRIKTGDGFQEYLNSFPNQHLEFCIYQDILFLKSWFKVGK